MVRKKVLVVKKGVQGCLGLVLTNTPFFTANVGMEPYEHPPTHSLPTTPISKFTVGDLVHVFQGTAAYVKARNTVAFIGRIVGTTMAMRSGRYIPNPNPNRNPKQRILSQLCCFVGLVLYKL
jgi:hypothetical protein